MQFDWTAHSTFFSIFSRLPYTARRIVVTTKQYLTPPTFCLIDFGQTVPAIVTANVVGQLSRAFLTISFILCICDVFRVKSNLIFRHNLNHVFLIKSASGNEIAKSNYKSQQNESRAPLPFGQPIVHLHATNLIIIHLSSQPCILSRRRELLSKQWKSL